MSIEVFVSIPSVIAHLNLAVFYAYREGSGRLVSWRGQCRAGADAKACAVARANDLVAFDGAARELSTIMGADVFDGVILAVEVEYDDLRVVHIFDTPFAWGEFFDARYRDPFTHCNPSFIYRPRQIACWVRPCVIRDPLPRSAETDWAAWTNSGLVRMKLSAADIRHLDLFGSRSFFCANF